tara:strand:- start:474 stop:1055 length:582 start_codon:yes stop_codon:yes gene_type:complete
MELDGIIQPDTWDDALELCVGRVTQYMEDGVAHPSHKHGAALSLIRSEFDDCMANAYGNEISFPSPEMFDWWTGFTIMCIQASDWLLEGFEEFNVEQPMNIVGQYKYVTGASHVQRLGHDAVLVHIDYAIESLEGVALASSQFHGGKDLSPGQIYAWTQNEAIELVRWALTGMMVAWDSWSLPLREAENENDV